MKKLFIILFSLVGLLLVPLLVHAEDEPKPKGTTGETTKAATRLLNPLDRFNPVDPSKQDADTGFANAVGRLVVQAIGALAALSLIPIVVGGIYMISASGNPEMVKKGRASITWGVIGLVLGLSAVIIYGFLLDLIII